jgi:hypothetical protein
MNKNVTAALKQDHDEILAQLARVTIGSGELAELALKIRGLCSAHFDVEERCVFTLFAAANDVTHGKLVTSAPEIQDQVSQFNACVSSLRLQHRLLHGSLDRLSLMARRQGMEEMLGLARRLRDHERMEHDVVYPGAMLVRNYLSAQRRNRVSIPTYAGDEGFNG